MDIYDRIINLVDPKIVGIEIGPFIDDSYKNTRSFKNVMNYKYDGYHLVSSIVLLQSYSIIFVCQPLA